MKNLTLIILLGIFLVTSCGSDSSKKKVVEDEGNSGTGKAMVIATTEAVVNGDNTINDFAYQKPTFFQKTLSLIISTAYAVGDIVLTLVPVFTISDGDPQANGYTVGNSPTANSISLQPTQLYSGATSCWSNGSDINGVVNGVDCTLSTSKLNNTGLLSLKTNLTKMAVGEQYHIVVASANSVGNAVTSSWGFALKCIKDTNINGDYTDDGETFDSTNVCADSDVNNCGGKAVQAYTPNTKGDLLLKILEANHKCEIYYRGLARITGINPARTYHNDGNIHTVCGLGGFPGDATGCTDTNISRAAFQTAASTVNSSTEITVSFNGISIEADAPKSYLNVYGTTNDFSIVDSVGDSFDNASWIVSQGTLAGTGTTWSGWRMGAYGNTLILVTAETTDDLLYQKKILMQITK